MTYKTILLSNCLFWLLVSCQGNQTVKSETQKRKEQLEYIEKQKIQIENDIKEQSRHDSLIYYSVKADQQLKLKKFKLAILDLDSALYFAKEQEKEEILFRKAKINFDIKDYNNAIACYDKLIADEYNLAQTFYLRAICHQKNHHLQESVNDLNKAIDLGNDEANIVYEKINPIKKRVAYYVTRCCDGTTSNAKGRGACSHHGGVCDWNDPVYEEYRKYQ